MSDFGSTCISLAQPASLCVSGTTPGGLRQSESQKMSTLHRNGHWRMGVGLGMRGLGSYPFWGLTLSA